MTKIIITYVHVFSVWWKECEKKTFLNYFTVQNWEINMFETENVKLLISNLTIETWPHYFHTSREWDFKTPRLTFEAICIGKIVSGLHVEMVTVLLKNSDLEKSFLQCKPSADIDGCENIFEITIIIATKYLTYYAG